MRLKCLSLAIKDLAGIRSYITRDNPDAAQRVAKRLKESIGKLKTMPDMGKPGPIRFS